MDDSRGPQKAATFPTPWSNLAIPAIILIILWALPVSYQTNDDIQFQQVFEGNSYFGIARDSHCIHVHHWIGSVVSWFDTAVPTVAWYGLFIAASYVMAFTIIISGVYRGMNSLGPRCRLMATTLFGASFVVMPLLLFQFTVVAGLLALAGMMAPIRLVVLRDSVPTSTWVISLVLLIVAFMFRFQIVYIVISICSAALVTPILRNRAWKIAARSGAFVVMIGFAGLVLEHVNMAAYSLDPDLGRLFLFNRVRATVNGTVSRFTTPKSNAVSLPTNQRALVREGVNSHSLGGEAPSVADYVERLSDADLAVMRKWLAIDAGPLSLDRIARAPIRDNPRVAKEHNPSVSGSADIQVRSSQDHGSIRKLEGILAGRSPRRSLLMLSLLCVFGASAALIGISAAVEGFARASPAALTAAATVLFIALSTVVLDRALYRVTLPLAMSLLVVSWITVPWHQVHVRMRIPGPPSRLPLITTVSVLCFFMALSSVIAVIQVGQNLAQKTILDETLRDAQTRSAGNHPILAWGSALNVEYSSPFRRVEKTLGRIYLVGLMSSHPNHVGWLKREFGDDVYLGMLGPDVYHIMSESSSAVLVRFIRFHYGQSMTEVEVGRIGSSDLELSLRSFRTDD